MHLHHFGYGFESILVRYAAPFHFFHDVGKALASLYPFDDGVGAIKVVMVSLLWLALLLMKGCLPPTVINPNADDMTTTVVGNHDAEWDGHMGDVAMVSQSRKFTSSNNSSNEPPKFAGGSNTLIGKPIGSILGAGSLC